MKKTILHIASLICATIIGLEAKGSNIGVLDDNPTISTVEIIQDNRSDTGDDRAYLFPFHIEYDEKSNSLIITYDQERTAELDLTNVNGAIISHQSISGSGIFTMPLPSVSGTFYLFMTTPTLIAYVTISKS
ncbi:MAG: hypothetical protein MJY94_04400 [Bacteroidales bacterium]|nr:hypothetical protein [Bacteroidales bacterium]